MRTEPLTVGVCSWSLRARSIPELQQMLNEVSADLVQIACGDPHHASWVEGDRLPEAARAAGIRMTGAMIGFPGEDYTTPETIRRTGGFADPATRADRLDRLRWALDRTRALGLGDLTLHAGFIPESGEAGRSAFVDTLGLVGRLAAEGGVRIGLETGQETAELLSRTLQDLACPSLGVNFDPANMLLYDKGDPLRAVQTLAPYLLSVHVKDAIPPTQPGTWGREMPLGQGKVDIRRFLKVLQQIGYRGPLCVEREAGAPETRLAEIGHAISYLKECLADA